MDNFKFDNIEEAIEDFRNGKMLIVADDEDRENEGDLICSAQMTTPDIINFMAREAGGLVCLAISREIADKLELPQMVEQNNESMKTAFTVSIDIFSVGIALSLTTKTIITACLIFAIEYS